MLNRDLLSQKFLAVQFVHGIIGISVVVKFHESVFAGLDKDVANASEFVKESLNIALTRIIGQIAEKHAGSFSRRHDGPQSRIQPRAARKSVFDGGKGSIGSVIRAGMRMPLNNGRTQYTNEY